MPLIKEKPATDWRYANFIYKGERSPEITIKVEIVNQLPDFNEAQNLFITTHFKDNKENWRIMQLKEKLIYKSSLDARKQIAVLDKNFKKATIYCLPINPRQVGDYDRQGKIREMKMKFVSDRNGFAWSIADIIYDFIQVLLISFMAKNNKGVFFHGVGIKDKTGQGFLFIGKSGTGKSTIAEIWHRHSHGQVLNDDRIILRKQKNSFYIYGSPWHGTFYDYLVSRSDVGKLSKLFFISHSNRNKISVISKKKAFQFLYTNTFPSFWHKEGLLNISSYCQDLVKNASLFKLGFKNNKKIINYIRSL